MIPVLFVYNGNSLAGSRVAGAALARDSVLMENSILVTGGAGFIGSNFILRAMQEDGPSVINLDKLTTPETLTI